MERKRRLCRTVLMAVISAACQKPETVQEYSVIFADCSCHTRAMDPDEEMITDISLMVFDEDGLAEECIWLPSADNELMISLIKGRTYSFRACINFGYQVYADDIRELDEVTYHLAYPDEYRNGIPMYASADGFMAEDSKEIILTPVRLMSKISLKMDRSRLSEDVEMSVRTVRIGNCPKSVKVFGNSKVEDESGCFASGFSRTDKETDPLNMILSDGKSREIHMYMLENLQGESEDDDRRDKVCSYIEMELDYISSEKYSFGNGLIYRFYLGENRNNRDVERNAHYRITVTPQDDGLGGDDWFVDKDNLADQGPVSFQAFPQQYIRGDIGDKIHIWCEFSPENAPFDVGISDMEDDKATGIYDYEIDEDGHGAVLTLTGPGRGLIYMEAGEPINDGALYIIEVNLPS